MALANYDPGVVVDGIRVEYRRARDSAVFVAIEEASFVVPQRSFTAVIGPSGCGKSTMLRVIAGLTRCCKGEVRVNAKPVAGPGDDRAVVFQAPALLPWRTVVRNVAFGLELRKMNRKEAEEKVRPLLELVGLSNFENSYPNELSGGMQQRVNLARALAVEPQVLLLDEPFSALDAQTREIMGNELLRIWESTNTTAILVTHQISEAILLSDQVVVLSEGPRSIVKEIVKVDLPRPRTEDLYHSREFLDLEEHLRSLIMHQSANAS